MSDCERKNAWWRGCRFEARYDAPAAEFPAAFEFQGTAASMRAIVEAKRPKTYIRDVCIRCGKTIERQK